MMKKLLLPLLVIVVLLGTSCDETEKGMVLMTISLIEPATVPFGDVLASNGTIPADAVNITLRSDLKDPTHLGANVYNDIILESITISFSRADGGADVPAPYRQLFSGRVPGGGYLNIDEYIIVPSTVKGQFPISDLIYFGYERSTNFVSIKMDVTMEFYGHTVEGDAVYCKGALSMEFTNWAD